MNAYTVEVVTRPVEDDNWTRLREVTDHLPGTILLEDAEEPTFIIPVDAPTLRAAALLVEGAMRVLDHEIIWGRAYLCQQQPVPARAVLETDLTPAWLEDEATTLDARNAALV